jgi:hypothetical protein
MSRIFCPEPEKELSKSFTFTHWGVKCGGEEGEAKAAL